MSATVQSRHSGSDSPSMWQSPNQPADRRATLRRCSMLLLPSPRARGTRFDQFLILIPLSRDFGTPDPSSKASFTKLRQDSTKRATSAGAPPRFWGSAGVEPGNHGTSGGSTRRAASSRRHLLGHEDVVASRFDGGGPPSPNCVIGDKAFSFTCAASRRRCPELWGPEQPTLRTINDVPPAPARGALGRHPVLRADRHGVAMTGRVRRDDRLLLSEPAERMVATAGQFAPPDGTVAAWPARSPPTRSSTASG